MVRTRGGTVIPGLAAGADEGKGKKVIGTAMGKLFNGSNTLEMEAFAITREEKYVARVDASEGGSFKSKTYTVTQK